MPAPGASNRSLISRTHKTLDTARTCQGDQPPPAAWALLFPTRSDNPEPILRVTQKHALEMVPSERPLLPRTLGTNCKKLCSQPNPHHAMALSCWGAAQMGPSAGTCMPMLLSTSPRISTHRVPSSASPEPLGTSFLGRHSALHPQPLPGPSPL